jgi:hypothetical protein
MNLGFQEFVLQGNPNSKIGPHKCATKLVDAHANEGMKSFLNKDNFFYD